MYGWSVFWFLMGLITVVMILGFKQMAVEKGISMTWWKWLISVLWWVAFLFAVAVPFTFIGEGELAAGAWMSLFSVVPAAILGVVVWRVVVSRRRV